MFGNSSTVAAINRVKNSLEYSLNKKYNINNEEITNTILKIHGLHKDNFDFINNIETIILQGITDNSIDPNANKNETLVAGIFNESTAPINKIIGYRFLYRKLKELYGKEKAKQLTGDLYDFSLAISDSTKILLPYCWAVDFSKLVLNGRSFGNLPSAPPKRLYSYVAAVNETIHQMSNHIAGALAIGSFFIDAAHMLIYREKYTLEDIKIKEDIKKYIINCYQNFVHSVNHLSRNSSESPFTNLSIFDTPKLKALLSDDNMGWYFESNKNVNREEYLDYVIEYIKELQFLFMEFFDKGDPLNNGIPYRFPVVTLNLSKHDNSEIKILDKDFIEKVSKYDIYRYNILVSEGSKVASCCRLLSDTDMLELGSQMNSFGGSGLSLGSHRVVTINFNRIALESESYEDYFLKLQTKIEDTALVLKAHKELIKDGVSYNLHPFISNGYINLDRMFSTFGVLGLVEAAQYLKKKFSVHKDTIEDSLIFLNIKVKEMSEKYQIIGNIEQIPGESMAVKLAQIDNLLFNTEYNLYTNQFIPLWKNVSIWDRMDIDGKYNKMFTGGGIVHFNLGEKVTPTQAKKLISYACKSGCEHFALNSVYSQCINKHVSFGNHTVCPMCNAKISDRYTRVVGFMTPVSSWNKTRREWEFPKRQFREL